MHKNLQSICLALLVSVLTVNPAGAQNTCGNSAPSQQWESAFSKQVEKYLENNQHLKSQQAGHVIPVVVHVIHNGEPYGTFPNVDSNQIKSQIDALNADFAGTGFNSSNVPPYFANAKANTGIRFCLAAQNFSGAPMNEKGVNRLSTLAYNWTNLATPTLELKQYFKSTIIPATIWDPTKYLNFWISEKPVSQTMNGFSTYPSQSGLIGLFGGDYGTTTDDGIWIWVNAFGTVGSVVGPTNQGRTATHHVGHWLGLRHIWGDGNCLSDYVSDTPPSKGPHTGCVPVPTPIDRCGTGLSPNGEMPMNFMDRSNDACMYMFTNGQKLRMLTALSQSTNRNALGTHDLCEPYPAPASSSAIASFNLNNNVCVNSPVFPYNSSTGYPNPSYLWSSSPAVTFSPSTNAVNPNLIFPATGMYTITLVASNSVSSSSYSLVVNATGTCPAQPVCLDSLRMIKKPDSLKLYKAPIDNTVIDCLSGNTGNLAGTNCYQDREFAQFYPASSYTAIAFPQVHSVIVLFDSAGTRPAGSSAPVSCKIYGGNVATGPGGVPIGQSAITSLGAIVASTKTTSVNYIGNQVVMQNNKIIPYRFDFPQPIIINSPSSGFFASIEIPVGTVNDSVRIYTDSKFNTTFDSSGWFRNFNYNWRTFRTYRGAKVHLAIIPQISCSAVLGLNDDNAVLRSNITVMPNPGNGLFNLLFTLPKEENQILINIYNAVGQLVSSEKLEHISNNAMTVDLSDRADGIYFCEISNGREKVVKKLIITR